MNYYDARKQTTPGPMEAKHFLNEHDIPDADWRMFGHDHLLIGSVIVPYGNKARRHADMHLIAHCFNHFDELLAEMKAATCILHGEYPLSDPRRQDALRMDKLIAECEEVKI